MNSRHKSRYDKREERQKRDEENSRDMRTLENLGFAISSKTQNNDNCDNGNIDADSLSARNETEFVGISALEVLSDISAFSLYTDCAKIDIGVFKLNVTPKDVEDAILRSPEPHPITYPVDKHGSQFPTYLLSFHLKKERNSSS